MKNALLIVSILISSIVFAQSDDLPIDESLIVKLAKVGNGGYLSKTELDKANELEINERDAVIVSFVYVCDKTGYEMMEVNDGPKLNAKIIGHIKNAKIGTKVRFENIKVENASGEVLAKPVMITIKS
jgi:hypothetical protein